MNVAMTGPRTYEAADEINDSAGAQSVEEDLFALNALAPELLGGLPALFEETVRESLSYMLGTKESAGVLSWFQGDELKYRYGVYARLLELYGNKASPIQSMIDRVFGLRVHELLRQLC
jgi:hypothetical protein